jgi:Alpha-L-fucosidase
VKAFFPPQMPITRKNFLTFMVSVPAGILCGGTASMPSLRAAIPHTPEPLIPSLTPDIRLYGATAADIGGNAQLDQLKISVKCKDSSTIKWNLTASEAGQYDLFISCAVPSPGFGLEISSGSNSVKANLTPSEGVYRSIEGDWFFNFERSRLDGRLQLTRGVNPVTLHLSGADKDQAVRFRCLEVLPVSASAEMTDVEAKARADRASTDWFVKAGYGVMFHWTDFTQPREGTKKPYPDAVEAFDVNAFADLLEQMGAGYVIFTLNHAHPHCPAPIRAWETVHPQWTTRRDLIGDIADALKKHAIRLILYINSPVMTKFGKTGETGLYELTFSEEQFTHIHKDILSEIGSRYGEKLAGYWFDSWYQSLAAYPDVPVESIYRYTKVGNPNRVTALNFWIFPVLTPWQDYWAGEFNRLQNSFPSRYIRRGAGKGFQAHGLLSMLESWVHSDPGPIPPPQFSVQDLVAYVKANMERQAVTTINIGIYQDGTVEQSSLEMMRQLRRAIRGE